MHTSFAYSCSSLREMVSALLRVRCTLPFASSALRDGPANTPKLARVVRGSRAMASTTTAASSSSTFLHKPASASWKPGDPVRFGTGSPYSATSTSSSTSAPTTWSKSPWQPGMPVRLDHERTLPTIVDSLPLKPVANRGNGKQPAKRPMKAKKAEASSQ